MIKNILTIAYNFVAKKKTKGGGLFGIAVLCTALLSSFAFQAEASHLLGADMAINQYEKGKFEIRVYVYSDCGSLSSLRFTPITVKSNCGNFNHSGGAGPFG